MSFSISRSLNPISLKTEPYKQPADIDNDENTQHPLQPVWVYGTYSYYLQQAQADGAPHIDRRMSPADEQVGEQIDDGNKCSPNT